MLFLKVSNITGVAIKTDEYVPTICENMGLKKGSDPFGQCVVELIKQIREDD